MKGILIILMKKYLKNNLNKIFIIYFIKFILVKIFKIKMKMKIINKWFIKIVMNKLIQELWEIITFYIQDKLGLKIRRKDKKTVRKFVLLIPIIIIILIKLKQIILNTEITWVNSLEDQ